MKRFFSAVSLCIFLLLSGLFFLYPATKAQTDVLSRLINLPAPPPPNPLAERVYKNRPEEFYKKSSPPKDDALIEDLLDYWQNQSGSYIEMGYNIKPSEKTLERILGEIEKTPEQLPNFLNILPESSEITSFVKRLYDGGVSEIKDDGEEEYRWTDEVKNWLTYHSRYFSDELLKTAQEVEDKDEYVTNQNELLALARVDWEKARPILDRLINDRSKPVSQVLARWAFYRRALDTDSLSDIEKYRDELKAVVEDKSALPGMRDLALDALIKEKEWSGRDDWYMSLLNDETLAELKVNGQVFTGLTTIMYYAPPEKYVDKMLKLLKSDNPTVRGAAVRNLIKIINEKNPEVIRAMLPWLEDKNWAKETSGERQMLAAALQNVTLSESVPGLIAALNEKDRREVSDVTYSNSNMMNSSMTAASNSNVKSNAGIKTEEYYPLRDAAIGALAAQKDARAAAALRAILPEVEDWQRGGVVRALLFSRGYSVDEQIEALESVAVSYQNEMTANTNSISNTNPATEYNANLYAADEMMNGNYSVSVKPYNPNEIKAVLGAELIGSTEPDENLVAGLIARIGILEAKDPQLAFALRKIMQNWRGAAINSLLLDDLKNNKADADLIVKLLSLRKELRENQLNEVLDIRSGSPTALGVAACLLEDDNEYAAILASDNAESKTAMLGCARMIRAKLSIQKVAEDLKSPNKLLALAAERYLESEDSPQAQAIVLSHHPNEAKILGAKGFFIADDAPPENAGFLTELYASVDEATPPELYYYIEAFNGKITQTERKLQKEVKENQDLLGIYAYDDNFIRVYQDKIIFSWEEDPARYRERALTRQEFDYFRNYLAAERVEELPPFLSLCEECEGKEFLMLGRQGGRRVFVIGDKLPKFFTRLESLFAEMRKPPAKLHYRLEKDVAGLEILFAHENLRALAVWKNGGDFRVLLEDAARRRQIDKELQKLDENDETNEQTDYEKLEETRRSRRLRREFENFAWYKIEPGGKPLVLTVQPTQAAFIPARDGLSAPATNQQWKAKAAGFEIRADESGLYKVSGGKLVKIGDGYYDKPPVVTPNGRWAVISKYGEAEGGNFLARVNLLTNKEIKINLSRKYPMYEAIAFLPSHNKVLIFAGSNSDYEYGDEHDYAVREDHKYETLRRGDYFLLDAETGALQPVKGETRPLAHQTFRPLQPAQNPDEFWAAIPDAEKNETQIGIYNAKTLSFKPLSKIPQIQFDSMKMWIDAGKIYFVYEGHLLSLPLK